MISEIHELENLLSVIPEDNVIDRMSLESRLNSVKDILSKSPKFAETSKARLTFRGKPVLRGYGILADFGAKAAETFSDAYTNVIAGLNGNLRDAGPIPNRDKHQLLITGTAIGSFGFEFELPQNQQHVLPFTEHENVEEAMKKINTLFKLTAEGSDDEVTEIVAEIHPRAVKKIHEFLKLLVQEEAWCGLEFGDSFFRYADYEQIKAATNRIGDENIRASEESYHGEFQGILPGIRTFEFKPSNKEGVIRGKIDISIKNPEILNHQWLYKPVTVKLYVMQVGSGRPRYTLTSLSDLSAGQ
jgi:hypothetical protein